MRSTWIALSACVLGLMMIGSSLVAGGAASANSIGAGGAAAALPFHGTPDPNATPLPLDNGDLPAGYTPTYYRDIEPILQDECMSCHMPDGIGYAYFPMEDVRDVSEGDAPDYIAFVTGIDYMPPWQPGPASPTMLHQRSLTELEINTLAAWAEAGAPLGDEADRRDTLPSPSVNALRPDVVMTMAEAYSADGSLEDDYRCFIMEPNFDEDVYITGSDFQPGNTEIAHHALVFVVPDEMRADALAMDAADEGFGWECFGGTGLQTGDPMNSVLDPQQLIRALQAQEVDLAALAQTLNVRSGEELRQRSWQEIEQVLIDAGVDMERLMMDAGLRDLNLASMNGSANRLVQGWVPGSVPTQYPPNTGLFAPANSFIVVQMHYNTTAGGGTDQSTLRLQVEPFSPDITPIFGRPLVAPVEIPCPDGVENEACNREIAQQQVINPRTSDALLAACGQSLSDYADNTAENAYGYCDYPVNVEGWVIEVGGHMHELGSAMRITLNPAAEDEQILLEIPEWDFHWQGTYFLANPVEIKPGDTIRVECWWDNSEGERYVVWGEGTRDEMCWNPVNIIPRQEGREITDYGYTMPAHSDMMLDVPDDVPTPAISILGLTPAEGGGYWLELSVENFRFAPENVDSDNVWGEGHAHLYINGVKISRVFEERYYIASLEAGLNTITVTLNANNHATLMHDGAVLGDSLVIGVE